MRHTSFPGLPSHKTLPCRLGLRKCFPSPCETSMIRRLAYDSFSGDWYYNELSEKVMIKGFRIRGCVSLGAVKRDSTPFMGGV